MATLNLGRVRLNFKGDFDSLNGTALVFFDAVTFNGSLYVVTASAGVTVNTNAASGNQPPKSSSTAFTKITEGFKFHSSWDTTKIYYKNDIVLFGNTSYIALAEVSASADNPEVEIANSTGKWSPLAQGFGTFVADYAGNTAQAVGDVVLWQGIVYRVKTAITNSQNPNTTAASFDIVVPGLDPKGQWSAGTYYYRQIAEFHGKSYVVKNTAGTTNQPLNSSNGSVNTDWELLTDGFNFTGAYNNSSSDGYYPGDVVTYNAKLYAVTGRLPSGTNPTQSASNVTLLFTVAENIEDLNNVSVSNIGTGSLLQYDGSNWNATPVNANFDISPNGSTGTVIVGTNYIGRGNFGAQSLAPKSYVDSVANGLDVKASCRVATTANLSSAYSGADLTLTNNATQAALQIDSINVNNGDRVLVKDQTTATQNGIYTVTDKGSGSTNWILTRVEDADSAIEVTGGAFTFIETGTINANNGFVATHIGTPTLGSDNITFEQFSGAGQITAGTGLTKSGNTINVVGSTTIDADADAIHVNSSGTANQTLLSSGTVGTEATFGALPLNSADAVTGTLPVGKGGTGATSFTANGLLYGNAANAVQVTAQGGAGQIVFSNSGVPAYTDKLNAGTYGGTSAVSGGATARILVYRSESASQTPAAGDMQIGELAVNTADKKIFIKNSSNQIIELANNSDLSSFVTDTDNALRLSADTGGYRDITVNEQVKVIGGSGISTVTAENGAVTELTVSSNLNSLTTATVHVDDSIAFIDSSDTNASKKETIEDFLGVVKGAGLQVTAKQLALDHNSVSAATVTKDDSITFIDATDNSTKKDTIEDFLTAVVASNSGISITAKQLSSDVQSLPNSATINKADTIVFLDADDNSTQKSTIANLLTAVKGTGLTISAGQLTTNFLDLPDTPNAYTSQVGKSLKVNSGATGLEFESYLPLAGGTLTGDLNLGSNDFTSTGKLYYNNNIQQASNLPGATTYAGTFVYLHNPGAAYYAHADNNWKRLAEQSELVTTFVGLTDTPSSFASGDAGKFVKVNSSYDALEFVTVTTGATNFTGLSDTPSSFASGDAGKFVKVNSSYNALEFTSDPGYLTAIDIVNDLSPELGGNLDVNNKKITSSGGGDIDIEPNGTGDVLLGNFKFDADQTVGSGQDNYVMTYDHSAGKISLEAAAGGGGGSLTVQNAGSGLGTATTMDFTGAGVTASTNGSGTVTVNIPGGAATGLDSIVAAIALG